MRDVILEKLGVVCNIWAKRLETGDRFEELVKDFLQNGYKHIEIRDDVYLRSTATGRFFEEIEAAMERYSDAQWKAICDNRNQLPSSEHLYDGRDRTLFQRIASFAADTAGAIFSYAIAHPWEVTPDSVERDDLRIIKAKRLAYLFCPDSARLRLVDTVFEGPLDEETAVSNLKRHRSLVEIYPVTLCIENAHLPATTTFELAVQGDVAFCYDEANTYSPDGSVLNPPEEFWSDVEVSRLTSVHIKQKTGSGVLSTVEDGFVDFKKILDFLKQTDYAGDLLIENAPSNKPLEDAVKSREYLLAVSAPAD
jgi:sugar phosphate isomerase/epimerase